MKNLSLIFLIFFTFICNAQQQNVVIAEEKDPMVATLYSAVIPGLGQLYYAEDWWDYTKMGIAIAGIPIAVGVAMYYHNNYIQFRKAYLLRKEGGKDEFPNYREETLLYIQKLNQKSREEAILGIIIVYLLNVIDAHVSTHLLYFNVDELLTLSPKVINIDNGLITTPALGFSLSYKF